MASADDATNLTRANLRLCRLRSWPNYTGLGFNIENTTPPPHIIRSVESNSPAAAAGLRILDVVLAVNNQNVTNSDYRTTTQAIKNARDTGDFVDLLVIERRFFVPFKNKGVIFDPAYARTIQTPIAMPREYAEFPKYTPRTCDIRLGANDQSFGFEVVNGPRDIGISIQDVLPNSPAGRTALRRCDRVLEIDGKFVDKEKSRAIFERLTKARAKGAVRLYVVDTNTYKHFQDSRIPLKSKEFRSSTFARSYRPEPTSTYINVVDVNNEAGTEVADVPRSTPYRPPSPGNVYQLSTGGGGSTTSSTLPQDDIRLCTITRASATDTYGIELIYHRRDLYHSLKVAPNDGNKPNNAALAGLQSGDRLIEINGENVENIGDDQVKQRIRAVQYPQPLQLLVADQATYERYKSQNKLIHSRLPNVRRLPQGGTTRLDSFEGRRPDSAPVTTTTASSVAERSPGGVGALVMDVFDEGRASLESSLTNRQQYQLRRTPGVSSYGFSVMSTEAGVTKHRITEILPNSPAAQQGLRVGDIILSVNNQDVTRMNADDFTKFLRASVQNADAIGQPLVLEVTHDEAFQPSLPSSAAIKRTPEPSSSNVPSSGAAAAKPPLPINLDRQTSQNQSQASSSSHPTTSQGGSQRRRILQPTHPIGEPPTTVSTRPIVSRNGSQKSSADPTFAPYQNGTANIHPFDQLPPTHSYPNGYDSSRYTRDDIRANLTASSTSLHRSRENLTRGAVDLVSRNRLLRYCQLFSGPSQSFGFQLKADGNKHIIHSIQLDSPAMRAGLGENDRLLEVNDENVEGKSTKEVAVLIRNAAYQNKLRVLVAPSDVKVLSRRTARSLTTLNDANYSRNSSVRSRYDEPYSSSSVDRYQSNSRRHDERDYRRRTSLTNSPYQHRSEPSEPLPRKCVLQRDPNFRGCGFQVTQKHDCDTPIIVDISPNSPAKRSGLAEGDHIIYINSQNVQNFTSFDDILHLIQRSFEENDQLTLITLTDPGYQVLRRRGGYLDSTAFDYQARSIDQLQPRLCQLKLYNHQYNFGFRLQQNDCVSIRDIQINSAAETAGLRRDDVILEINGRSTRYLSLQQIEQIIQTSQEERKLDLLVIDPDGYRFSVRHAIPLNSYLSFVQRGEEQMTMINQRHSHPPVYL